MMKKLLFCSFIMVAVALDGCSASSIQMLKNQDIETSRAYQLHGQLTQGSFFADDLAVITETENHGNDSLMASEASLLINAEDKEVLYADNVYEKLYPASITKIMTALLVLRKGNLTDMVTISKNASNILEPGAKLCGFEEGDVISMEELLNCLLIYSGNDAGVAIAEHLAGSVEKFADMMNQEARRLGAVHSHFLNPHGLHDDNHYTTAYDLYLIFHELIQYDTFCSIINKASYTASYTDREGNAKQKTFQTTNRFLTGEAMTEEGTIVIGGKTGTTSKAGNCLILLCRDRNKKPYIGLVLKALGNDQLYSQMSHLLSKIP